jgi:hypothetical protein
MMGYRSWISNRLEKLHGLRGKFTSNIKLISILHILCKANSHFARSFYFPYPKCDTYRFIEEKRTRIRAVEGHANVEDFHIHSNMAAMMTTVMVMPVCAPRATATSSSGVTGE